MPGGNDDPADLPKASVIVATLAAMEKRHFEILYAAIPADGRPVDAESHLVVASLRRSLDNITGFLAMADQRNIFCGMPIIRFQLDTAMRLFGRKLVTDVGDFLEYIATGKRLGRYKDRNGKLMTDHHLHTELTKSHADVSSLYEETSGFVHFSAHHIHRVLDFERYRVTGDVKFRDPDEMTAGWNDEEVRCALVCMLWATEAVLAECGEWYLSKQPGGVAPEA